MTTREAFDKLTSERGWYKRCDINEDTARSLKRNFKEGRISIEKMESLLRAAGWKKKPEVWKPT